MNQLLSVLGVLQERIVIAVLTIPDVQDWLFAVTLLLTIQPVMSSLPIDATVTFSE